MRDARPRRSVRPGEDDAPRRPATEVSRCASALPPSSPAPRSSSRSAARPSRSPRRSSRRPAASRAPCAGFIAVNGDPAKGMANFPDQFTSAKPLIGARFNCAGAAPQARRVNVGVYEVRFPGNAAQVASASSGDRGDDDRLRRRRRVPDQPLGAGPPGRRRHVVQRRSPCRRLDRSTTPTSGCATRRTRSSWSSGVRLRRTRSGTRSASTSIACAPAGGASTTPMPSCCSPGAESSGWLLPSPPSRRPSASEPAARGSRTAPGTHSASAPPCTSTGASRRSRGHRPHPTRRPRDVFETPAARTILFGGSSGSDTWAWDCGGRKMLNDVGPAPCEEPPDLAGRARSFGGRASRRRELCSSTEPR